MDIHIDRVRKRKSEESKDGTERKWRDMLSYELIYLLISFTEQ